MDSEQLEITVLQDGVQITIPSHLTDSALLREVKRRAVKRFPVILAGLADGRLNVTTVRLLARRLTPENHAALLAEASGRSKREVEEIVALHYPQPVFGMQPMRNPQLAL